MGKFGTDKHIACPACHQVDMGTQRIMLHDFTCVPAHVFVANICRSCGFMYTVFPAGIFSVKEDGSIGNRIAAREVFD